MLKDRVTVNENGFSLYEDKDNPNRQAYYTTFRLADDEINKGQGIKVEYWHAATDKDQDVQNNTYICIWENMNICWLVFSVQLVLERHHFLSA